MQSISGDKGKSGFVTREQLRVMGISFGHQELKQRARRMVSEKRLKYNPSLDGVKSFVSSRQGQGDVADFGSRMRASRFRAGREGSGPFHPTRNSGNLCFSPLLLSHFSQKCDSDMRVLDLSILLRTKCCTHPTRCAQIVADANTTLGNTEGSAAAGRRP